MRIKIISRPIEGIFPSEEPQVEMSYGGQLNGGLNLGLPRFNANMPLSQENPFSTNSTLKPVPRGESEIEAEKGETIVGDFDQDGMLEHMGVGGKRHSQGGTPLDNIPGGAFVFSDTKAMKIKDPEILKHFGKNGSKGETPAALAKQYKLNEYKAILNDPNSDKLQKKTAQLNMDNSLAKLQDLAVVNEGLKGFPQGMPEIGASDEGIVEAKYGGRFQMGGMNAVNYMKYGKKPVQNTKPAVDPNDPRYWSQSYYNSIPMTQQPTGPGMYTTGIPYTQPGNNPNWTRDTVPFRFDQNPTQGSPYEWAPPTFPTVTTSNSGFNDGEISAGEIAESRATNPEPGNMNLSNPAYKNYGASRGDNFARLAAGYALANTQRYSPFAAPIPQPNLINPTYMSPEREIAAIQENANTQGMIGAYTQPGQQQRSNMSSTQGQALTGIANTVGRYANANVDTANKVAGMNAETLNKYNFEKAARLTNLAAQENEFDSRYRDAINQRLGNFAKIEKGVETDIMNLNALNAMNPNYEYDPNSRTIKFKKGVHDLGSGIGSGEDIGQQLAQATSIIKRSNPGISDEDARRMAFDYIKAQKYKTTSNMYNPRKTTTQQSGTQHYSYPDYD